MTYRVRWIAENLAENTYGHLECLIETIDIEIGEHDEQIVTRRPCGAEVHVSWTLMCSPGPDDAITFEDAAGWAHASMWELACTEGHILALSANTRNTYDHAEPFRLDQILGEDDPPF